MYRLVPLALLAVPLFASAAPLRLADGRPFACVYYFGHWWDPWKSDDAPIRRDFVALRDMGISVLAVDHEWSQAIDGDWKWLDREHRLAKEAGLQILPWLSLKTWSDLSDPGRIALIKQWYGVDLKLSETQDGKPGCVQVWDEATLAAGTAYTLQYLERYSDQALLRVEWKGERRPVVALSVELAWADGGFDDASNARFRAWARGLYGDDLARLNAAWGTTLASFEDINPRDKAVFDFAHLQEGNAARPQACEDHIEFRSQTVSDSLGEMARRVREKRPEVLILAELPYQLAGKHPHAEGYRIGYAANPSCARSADILFLRSTGPLTQEEADALEKWTADTGQPIVLTYRTYSDWANERTPEQTTSSADLYAGQAAKHAHAFGFYSWNEMVDTHVAPSRPEDMAGPGALTPEQSARSVDLMRAMVRRYLELVGTE